MNVFSLPGALLLQGSDQTSVLWKLSESMSSFHTQDPLLTARELLPTLDNGQLSSAQEKLSSESNVREQTNDQNENTTITVTSEESNALITVTSEESNAPITVTSEESNAPITVTSEESNALHDVRKGRSCTFIDRMALEYLKWENLSL